MQRRLAGVTPAWNTASEALLMDSARILGKIHRALREYPPLPEGIGPGFFRYMTPRRALESYRHSLEIAMGRGEMGIAEDLRWRMKLAGEMAAPDFDLSRLTLCNTHGDYFISQFLCENGRLSAVIDWTTACVHPAVWEIMRSFVYAAPCCREGKVDAALLERFISAYCSEGSLNEYDRQNLVRLYCYQIAVCDYYGQYYASAAGNREIYLEQAYLATRLLKNMGGCLI